ncbi:hypothetical protein SESBI_33146 [Sesbania bispinosa]|nr:hypothetical protein SESBI_33146 [Sesbania bispinosa]
MASALQKLLRKSPATRTRIITCFHTPLVETLDLRRSPFIEVHRPIRPGPATEQHLGSSRCNVIFPSFPFGLLSNPISETGPLSPEADSEGNGDDDSRMLWADSVKKKRKQDEQAQVQETEEADEETKIGERNQSWVHFLWITPSVSTSKYKCKHIIGTY